MLKIRLQRVGRKHDPSYRVVLTDSRKAAQSGAVIENLGSYNPRSKKGETRLEGEKIKEWITKGAQVSGTVNNLLVEKGIIKGSKINVLPKKKEVEKAKEEAPKKTEQSSGEQPAPVAAEAEKGEAAAPAETPKEEATPAR